MVQDGDGMFGIGMVQDMWGWFRIGGDGSGYMRMVRVAGNSSG